MAEPEQLRDHWWWRPGWRTGRSFYTWHLTFADQPGARRLVVEYAPALAGLPMLDAVPLQWLHLTLQGIGFTDEVAREDVDRIVSAARARCRRLAPFTLIIGPAHADPETIQMPARPIEPLTELRHAIRRSIGDVWGQDNIPEAESGFRPHVSLGYANSTGPVAPVVNALSVRTSHTAEVAITAVSLIDLNRDNKAYQWTDVATVSLGEH